MHTDCVRRPDYVAVQGILSREEVQDLAERTLELRASRARQSVPPVKAQILPRSSRDDTYKPSSSEESSDDDSQRRRPRYNGYDNFPRPRATYHGTGPYGQLPHATWPIPNSVGTYTSHLPQQSPSYSMSPNTWVSPASPTYQIAPGRPSISKDKRREPVEKDKPKSRWRNNLTAAGVGGAAGSLLTVLVEAAQDL